MIERVDPISDNKMKALLKERKSGRGRERKIEREKVRKSDNYMG
jgi:hypothetical protein